MSFGRKFVGNFRNCVGSFGVHCERLVLWIFYHTSRIQYQIVFAVKCHVYFVEVPIEGYYRTNGASHNCVENFSKILHHIRIQLLRTPQYGHTRERRDGSPLMKNSLPSQLPSAEILGDSQHEARGASQLKEDVSLKQEAMQASVEDVRSVKHDVKTKVTSIDGDSDVEGFPLEDETRGSEYGSNDSNTSWPRSYDGEEIKNDNLDDKVSDEGIKSTRPRLKYQCSECDKRFAFKAHLNSHTVSHQTIRQYACEYCGKAFKRQQNLKQHVAIHLNEKRHKCKICGKGFNTNSMLCSHKVVHKARNEGLKKHVCGYCGRKFIRRQNMKSHMKRHLKKGQYKCTNCDKVLRTGTALTRHMKTHEAVRNCPCEICGKLFTQQYITKTHMKICRNERQYKCSVCDKTFNTNSALNSHTKKHETARNFTCEYCGKAFKRKGNMNDHMKRHIDEKQYKCTVCGKGHNTHSGLTMHMKTHETARNYACEYCGKTFKRQQHMKNHVATHLDEKRHQCVVCGKGFNTSSLLCSHKKSHMSVKQFSCELCGKMFKRQQHMKNHMVTHFGDKSYECKICAKGFYTKSMLDSHRKHCNSDNQECTMCHEVIKGGKRMFQQHMKTHPIEYTCEICGRTFKQKANMKAHTDIHLNERRHKCTMCDKAFNTSSQLGMHIRRAHKTEAADQHEETVRQGKTYT